MINECTRCALHRKRRQEVPARGSIPADILFIGEAPGKSEDLRGRPFYGPSGRILHAAIAKATEIAGLGEPPSYCITNVVRCAPYANGRRDVRPPTEEEAAACWPHLEDVYLRAKPRHVVFLGRVAEQHCKKRIPGGKYLYHPAFILRSGGQRSSQFREFVRSLCDLFEEEKRRKKLWRESTEAR